MKTDKIKRKSIAEVIREWQIDEHKKIFKKRKLKEMKNTKSKKKVSAKPKAKVLNKTVVNGRLTSYQKMKQKYEASIRQLTDDIITLIEEKDIMKVTTVKMQWRMRLDLEKVIWQL